MSQDIFSFDFASLQQNLQQDALTTKKEFGPDTRFWKISKNEDDTGTAVIRLIVDKNRVPFIRVFHHSFKKYDAATQKTRWYIEDSPETIGLPCPISEEWQRLRAIGTKEAVEESAMYNRKIKYITNIKVIKDPANPANDGKIFLWEFGTKLLDKILAKMNPSEDDIKLGIRPVELYDPMKGANIMLKIKKSAGFFNYDDTQVLDSTQGWESIQGAIEEIDAKTYELNEFLAKEHYKSYDALKASMNYVLTGISNKKKANADEQPAKSGDIDPSTLVKTSSMGTAPKKDEDLSFLEESAPVKEQPKAQPKQSAPADDDLDFLADL